jgi:hypothetical protein
MPFFQQAAAGVRPAVDAARGSILTAKEQLARARQRAEEARQRVRARMNGGRGRNYPSGLNAGIGFAALLFVAVIAGLALLVSAVESKNRRVTATTSPIPRVVEEAKAKLKDMKASWQPHAERVVTTRFPGESRAASQEVRGTVLVVCEWSKFAEPEQQSIKSQLSRLASVGFYLKGDTEPAPAMSDQTASSETETLAELRSAVGTKVYLSPDAAAAVRGWIEQSHAADLVLWINADPAEDPGSPGKAQHAAWLVGAPGVAQSTTTRAHQALEGR